MSLLFPSVVSSPPSLQHSSQTCWSWTAGDQKPCSLRLASEMWTAALHSVCRLSWANRPESCRKTALSVRTESSLAVSSLAHSEQCRFSDVWWRSHLPAKRPAGIVPSLLDLVQPRWSQLEKRSPLRGEEVGLLSMFVWLLGTFEWDRCCHTGVSLQANLCPTFLLPLSVFLPPPSSSFYSVFWQNYTRAITSISI